MTLNLWSKHYRAVASGFLAKQLTLSQPGGRLCPPQYYEPPPHRIEQPCDGPALHGHSRIRNQDFTKIKQTLS